MLEISIREDEIKRKEVEDLIGYIAMVEKSSPTGKNRGRATDDQDLVETSKDVGLNELLECPVCLVSYAKSQSDNGQLIFQCQRGMISQTCLTFQKMERSFFLTGHTMCGDCKERVTCCPVCRENFAILSPARCLLLEQIIARLNTKLSR